MSAASDASVSVAQRFFALARSALPGVALAGVIALAFAPALSAGFVDWDDRENFVDNLRFRGFEPAHLRWMFTSFHLGHYQPLAWLTLAGDHALWGLDARGYHATNVVLHAFTALAFLGFARRFLALWFPGWTSARCRCAAWLAAALFAVHPLRCESVCWVTERRDVLSGAFFVLSLRAWLAWLEHGERRHYRGALVLQLVSLFAKAWALVLPALFLVLERALVARGARLAPRRGGLRELAPFALVSAVFAGVTLVAQAQGTDARATLAEHGVDARLVQLGCAALFYAVRTLVPLDLSPHHELPPRAELLAWPYLGVAGAVLVVAALLWLGRKRFPAAWWSALAYLAVLAPVSGIAQAGPQLVAERYSYLACLPLALVAGALACSPRLAASIAFALGGAAVGALVVLTRAQCAVWHDATALWTRALEHDPRSAVALDHMAQLHVARSESLVDRAARRAEVETAAELYARALARSSNPLHLLNLGGVERLRADLDPERRDEHLRAGLERVEQALARSGEALARGNAPASWRRTHAALLADLGRFAEAEAEIARVVVEIPDDAGARFVYALVLAQRGAWRECARERAELCRLRPQSLPAWRALGDAWRRAGDVAAARAALSRALELARRGGNTVLAQAIAAELAALGG